MYVLEVIMPLLQVRDFPDDIYKEISYIARRQKRTIAQEVITLIKKGLGEETSNRERVSATLERINSWEVPETVKALDPAQVIRKMREERTNQILKNCGFSNEEGQ
jgi:ATP-dependent Lon protease